MQLVNPVRGNTTATLSAKLPNSLIVAQASPATTEPPNLRPGSQGPQVKELQTKLKQLRYYDGPVNGIYGEKTQLAVSTFQSSVGLTVDGVANPVTWQWLQALQPQQPIPTANQTLPELNLAPAANPKVPELNSRPAATQKPLADKPTPAATQKPLAAQPAPATTQKPLAAQPAPGTTQKSQLAVEQTDYVPRWVWLLIGLVLTIATVGGGLYLFMRLFGYEPFEEEDPPEKRIPHRQPSRAKRIEPASRKPQLESRNNGHRPAKTTVSETKRLEAKSKNQIAAKRVEVEPPNQTSARRVEVEPPNQTSARRVEVEPPNQTSARRVKVEPSNQTQPEALPLEQTTRLPKINIVDELIKDLGEPDPSKRRKAIWDLAQRGDSRAVQPLLDLMIDSDSKQRSLILEALSQIGTRTLKPMNRALAISLQDENAEVRKNAIRDLTRIYELISQVNQLLLHAADDPDAEVQETAEWALKQLNRIHSASGVENSRSLPNPGNRPDNSSSEPQR
ncbi:MAG TPA: peptidoglycan-binding protein [Candidatus Obscuribacterales bacterium]